MWTNERELEFLEEFQTESVLWNPKNIKHKDKQLIHDAWVRISDQMDIPVAELKKKRDSLMATYRGHKRKVKASLLSGTGAESVYKPIWFAFDLMDSFLNDAVNCRKTMNTETQNPPTSESQIENENTDDNDNHSQANQSETQFSSPMPTIPRRRKDPIELQEAGKAMKEAMSSLNKVLNKKQESEDDYDRYGKILANKLRKLSETESLQMMYQIDGLFIRHINNASFASSTYYTRPSSSCTSYSEPRSSPVVSDPPVIHILSDQIMNPVTVSTSNNQCDDILSQAFYEA